VLTAASIISGSMPWSGQLGERGHDQVFDPAGIVQHDPLEPGREVRLAGVQLQPDPDQVFAKPGVDQGFAQRRGGRAHQDMVEDAQRQRGLNVSHLVQRPVDRDHRLFGIRAFVAGIIAVNQAARRVKCRLRRDSSVDLLARETVQVGLDDPQPLGGIVIPVKENERVGRVIESVVKPLELLVSQIGDLGGIAARLNAISGVREQ